MSPQPRDFPPVVAVVFDIDGVVVDDSLHREKHNHVLTRFFPNVDFRITEDDWKRARGYADGDFYGYVLEKGKQQRIDFSGFPDRASYIGLIDSYYYGNLHRVALRPGAPDILAAVEDLSLARGAATNSAGEETGRKLSACGLEGKFQFVRYLDGATRPKPDPHLYEQSIAEVRKRMPGVDVQPCRILVIEDTATGAEAALRAGCRVVLWPAEGTVFDLRLHPVLEEGRRNGLLTAGETAQDIVVQIRSMAGDGNANRSDALPAPSAGQVISPR